MQTLLDLIQDKNFYFVRFHSEFEHSEDLLPRYAELKISDKSPFKLTKIVPDKNIYRLVLIINSSDTFKENQEDLAKIFSFFEKNLNKEVAFSARTVFHFSMKKYSTDPSLPVVIEENRGGFGKIMLNGLRISFPDAKEVENIILDIQKEACHHCGQDDLVFIQVMTNWKRSFSLDFSKEVITRSRDIATSFIRER